MQFDMETTLDLITTRATGTGVLNLSIWRICWTRRLWRKGSACWRKTGLRVWMR